MPCGRFKTMTAVQSLSRQQPRLLARHQAVQAEYPVTPSTADCLKLPAQLCHRYLQKRRVDRLLCAVCSCLQIAARCGAACAGSDLQQAGCLVAPSKVACLKLPVQFCHRHLQKRRVDQLLCAVCSCLKLLSCPLEPNTAAALQLLPPQQPVPKPLPPQQPVVF